MSLLEAHPAPTELELDYRKRLMLFSGRANPTLAARIASKLDVELGSVTLKTFTNGEVYCRYEQSVRGADVFIVQPTCGNPDYGLSANDALMELMVMVDAAVGGSAHRVIAVTPWYGYARQDKKSAPREPISARLVAHMLEAAGVDRVLTMSLLNYASQLKPLSDFSGEVSDERARADELKLARTLIQQTSSTEAGVDQYRDTYTEQFKAAIEAKVEGREVVVPEAEEEVPVVNLMDALRNSLKKRGARSRAEPARPAARRRKKA